MCKNVLCEDVQSAGYIYIYGDACVKMHRVKMYQSAGDVRMKEHV